MGLGETQCLWGGFYEDKIYLLLRGKQTRRLQPSHHNDRTVPGNPVDYVIQFAVLT
jgi:hypothetical protein